MALSLAKADLEQWALKCGVNYHTTSTRSNDVSFTTLKPLYQCIEVKLSLTKTSKIVILSPGPGIEPLLDKYKYTYRTYEGYARPTYVLKKAQGFFTYECTNFKEAIVEVKKMVKVISRLTCKICMGEWHLYKPYNPYHISRRYPREHCKICAAAVLIQRKFRARQTARKSAAALHIQTAWRNAAYNPDMRVCKKRNRAMAELYNMM